MRITWLAPLLFLVAACGSGKVTQKVSYEERIQAYRDNMNTEFSDPDTSPLTTEDLKVFEALDFYPIDSNFRVEARIKTTPESSPFEMQTSTDRKPIYRKYAEAYFSLNGQGDTLHIFQNLGLIKRPGYEDYLFVPFTDLTNGFETYGGGRYLDLRIQEGDVWVIDFNKAYNPYCAYNHKYSCPIPPKENFVNMNIKAGVRHNSGM